MSDKYQLKDGDILRDGVKIATRDPATGALDYLPDMDRFRAPVSAWLKQQGMDKPPVTPPEVAAKQAVARVAGAPIPELDPGEDETFTAPGGTVAPFPTTVIETKDERRARLQAELDALDGKPAAPASPVPLTESAEQRELRELREENNRLRTQRHPLPVHAPVQPTGLPAFTDGTPPGMVRPAFGEAPVAAIKVKTYPDAPPYDPVAGDKTPAFIHWLVKNHPEDARQRYFGRRILHGRDIEDVIREQHPKR